MFVRKKKVKKNEYAYLVESIYTRKGSRQKVKKYLGRIFYAENKLETFNNETFQGLLKELFNSLKLPKNVFINYTTKNIFFENKECTIQVGAGFIYSNLIKKLFNFKTNKEEIPGQELAELLSSTGMTFSEEFFVKLYQSLE